MKRFWADYSSRDFAALDRRRLIAVLPIGAIEQHGPHLPMSVDSCTVTGVAARLAAALPETSPVIILPTQAVCKSDEHIDYPGTLTLSAETLIRVLTEIGASVARAGVRKFVIVTSHGGNEEVMGIVTRNLRIRFDVMAVRTSWERFGRPEGLFSAHEVRRGIHGGDVETSLMLHFRPDLVDFGKARDFPSSADRAEMEFALLNAQSPHAFAWIASDLNPHGVVGNAAAATADKGRLTAQHQARGFVTLLEDVRKAKLSDWLT